MVAGLSASCGVRGETSLVSVAAFSWSWVGRGESMGLVNGGLLCLVLAQDLQDLILLLDIAVRRW